MINYQLNDEQENKFREWQKSKAKVTGSCIGGSYTICFTPTSIGLIVTAKCMDGTELDLTEDF